MFGGVGSGKALRYQCRGHRQNSRSADSAARFVSRRPRRSLGLVICAAAGTCLSWPLVRPNRVAMTGVDIVSAASTATPTTASSTTVATSRDESVVAAAVYRPGRDRGHGGVSSARRGEPLCRPAPNSTVSTVQPVDGASGAAVRFCHRDWTGQTSTSSSNPRDNIWLWGPRLSTPISGLSSSPLRGRPSNEEGINRQPAGRRRDSAVRARRVIDDSSDRRVV